MVCNVYMQLPFKSEFDEIDWLASNYWSFEDGRVLGRQRRGERM